MRIGTILTVAAFPEARKPSFKLSIDFGAIGIKQSSAQITTRYTMESLVGKQVVAVVNFPPKQIANFFSECLVLGVYAENGDVVLLQPTETVSNGMKIG